MDEFHFIVNPIARSGEGKKRFEAAAKHFDAEGIPYRVTFSEYAGHTPVIVREALQNGSKTLVAVGGDGTVRDVAGVLAGTDAVMGILPAGSGNDLCKSLGISMNLDEALAVLKAGNVRKMDACLANDRLFFNVAGIGFDVEVLLRTDQYKEKLNGMLPYALGIVSALKNLRPMTLTYSANGEETTIQSCIFSVGNGKYIGGGMKAVPDAIVDDGLFDVIIVKPVKRFVILPLIAFYVGGKHVKLGLGKLMRCKKLRIHCPGMTLNMDGELRDTDDAEFEIIPGGLCVRVPQ